MSPSKIFKVNTQQRYRTVPPWDPQCPFWRRNCNYWCSCLDLWNFELAHAGSEAMEKPSLRANLAWSINSRKFEANARDFPRIRHLWAAASSNGLKGSEILWPSGVGIFLSLHSFLLTNLEDSRPQSCVPHSSQFARPWSLPRWDTSERSIQTFQWVCWWCSTPCG